MNWVLFFRFEDSMLLQKTKRCIHHSFFKLLYFKPYYY